MDTAMISAWEKLAEDSVRLIRWNQHPSGGYVASPLFSHYTFSWLRDGSFIAYAMDTAGAHDSAAAFYEWVNRIIQGKIGQIDALIGKRERGEWIGQEQFLHTRYHLDGRDDSHSEWGHFQLDGYGAWLWGLGVHLRATGKEGIPASYRESVDATVRYLAAFWQYANFDCWEEYADQVHPSTLACIYGGLLSVAELDGREDLGALCATIREFLLTYAVEPDKGHFVKSIRPAGDRFDIANGGVDASLMWLCEPFGVFAPEHPALARTMERIQAELVTKDGGVRRYVTDSYYGGGEWILLTAWYGLVRLAAGDAAAAKEALGWIVSKADALGRLPEQSPDALEDRGDYDAWVRRWGTPALPLLWSHAMYLVLYHKLGAVN